VIIPSLRYGHNDSFLRVESNIPNLKQVAYTGTNSILWHVICKQTLRFDGRDWISGILAKSSNCAYFRLNDYHYSHLSIQVLLLATCTYKATFFSYC